MPSRSPSLVPGLRIGDYELVRRIGRGGMAEVWCAKRVSERRTSKFVAIKLVADQYVGDPRFQRMFRAEAELSGLLSHANIVQVFDEGEEDGRSYLVMEWVDGVNLLKVAAALTFIDDDSAKHEIISYIVGQLLYALGYAHGITLHDGNPLGIVHRDVSPQNVLVSNHGEVKLTDFGVAHHLLEESSGVHVKGKVRYMAPEQLGGQTRDPRLDLYAVGAILHELLDGRRFRHHVEDQRAMYIEVLSGKVPSLSRTVPPELDALRLALLQPDPKDRPPNAEAALMLLERFPGYGDARRDLTHLCAGLTGVMRPRVGPGTSQSYASASGSPGAAAVQAATQAPEPVPAASRVEPQPPSRPSAVLARPTSPSASSHPDHPDAERVQPRPVGPEPDRQPSITLRLAPDVPGAPQPVLGDTSPLPSLAWRPRGTETVQGEIGDTVGGSGALVGAGAQRGAPFDVPPDTSVMTPSMIRRIVEPSGPSSEDTDSQNEISTLTSLGSRPPASSPGPTAVSPRRARRGASIGMLLSFFLLGSLGMAVVFVVWGDAIQGTAGGLVEGRAQEDVKGVPERSEPPSAPPDEHEGVPATPPSPEPSASPPSGSPNGASGDDGDSSSGTSGAPEDVDQGSTTTTSDAPVAEEGEPVLPPPGTEPALRRPPRQRKEHSSLIVAVDGNEALQVRVGGGKPRTIKSRESWTFRVPVGKGRKVQWKLVADSSWTAHRVDIEAKCELQLRVPSRKTMTIGTCK
jgi:serine/threonine protein kinase